MLVRRIVPAFPSFRHMQLYVDRYLCDKMVPGNRVTVTGIYSIKKISGFKSQVQTMNLIGICFVCL